MIIGIGNDLIDIRRIEKTIARYGDRFIQRLYTPIEQKSRTNVDFERPLTRSGLRLRKPVQKHLVQVFAKVSSGVIWAS